MILTTENKTITLSLKTRNVVRTLDLMGKTDIKKALFEGLNRADAKTLAQTLVGLSDERLTVGEMYDFIDDYKAEHGCSVREIYADLITALNEKYFFGAKLSPEELENAFGNPITVDMDAVVEKIMEEMTRDAAKQSLTPSK